MCRYNVLYTALIARVIQHSLRRFSKLTDSYGCFKGSKKGAYCISALLCELIGRWSVLHSNAQSVRC